MRLTNFSAASLEVEGELEAAKVEDMSGSLHWRYPHGSRETILALAKPVSVVPSFLRQSRLIPKNNAKPMKMREESCTQQRHQVSNQWPERFIVDQCHEEPHVYHIIRLVEFGGKRRKNIVRI